MFTNLDMSAPAIQGCAKQMMARQSQAQSVTHEWHRSVQSQPVPSLLPLLYVANDVLQNSRRGGFQFLEAFSPILGDALCTMCKRCSDISLTGERAKRAIKQRRASASQYQKQRDGQSLL